MASAKPSARPKFRRTHAFLMEDDDSITMVWFGVRLGVYIYIKGQIALCTAVGQLQTKNLYTLRLWKNDSGSLFILVAVCFPRNQKHKLCSEQSEAASQYSEHYKTPNCIPTPIEGKLGWSYNRAPLWPHKKQLGSYGQSFKFCKTERTLYTSIYTLYILYKGSV